MAEIEKVTPDTLRDELIPSLMLKLEQYVVSSGKVGSYANEQGFDNNKAIADKLKVEINSKLKELGSMEL